MANQNLGRVVGQNAYEIAVANGYQGTEKEWLETLKGDSAYEIAVEQGFEGTEEEWLASLAGTSAYQSAVLGGYTGSEEQFNNILNSLGELYKILDYINGE